MYNLHKNRISGSKLLTKSMFVIECIIQREHTIRILQICHIPEGCMRDLDFHLGQPVYKLENDRIRIMTTVQNACVLPYFLFRDGREICPYWLAPWWNDRLYDDGSTISSTLRGNFFCMERKGLQGYEHGRCANSPWELDGVEDKQDRKVMKLRFSDPDGGWIEKHLEIRNDDTAVYETEILKGFSGEFTYNTHPCLKVPKECFAASLDGNWKEMQTANGKLLDTEGGTYSRLPALTRITDRKKVTTVYGEEVDLGRHPQPKGTIDLLIADTDATDGLGYAVFANPEEGYLYYQIKDAKVLPNTMFWLFNGGRHFAPWNGTTDGCLGVEEMSGRLFIFDEDFPDRPDRYMIPFEEGKDLSVRQVYGVVPLPEGERSIRASRLTDKGILVSFEGGTEAQITVDISFFR